ncbi:ABC transporter permease [Halomarina ordinaria]|uniref:ABC transporter permease n=1 Tax=Halomarina ordinaria TaxID=3033939 RepID=A0ABD5UAP7_9EURY|nr:ABC transporter permease [Halomarina sp. PSRA2]
MSWTAVAKKDFQDAARSRWLWGLSVLFVLFAAGAAYLYTVIPTFSGGGEAQTIGLLVFLLTPAGLLVPIIGLMISYKAVVGERESGSMKLMLSLPHSRGEMVLGKLVGRTLSTLIAIVVGFAVALVIVATQYGEFDPASYAVFVLVTMLFALVYISIGIAFSSLFASTSKALAGAVGLYALFEFLWGTVPLVLYYFVNGSSLQGYPTDWTRLITNLAPGAAYSNSVFALLPNDDITAMMGASASDPFYLQSWFGLVILLFWLVVPLAIGYARFNSSDL